MMIDVMLDGCRIPIARSVFIALLENSVASSRVPYHKALVTSSISYSDLIILARAGDIPYSLFFAPLSLVDAQINLKNHKLLQGLTKKTFSVNSRNSVKLRDIELIVKDLLRKQELLKMNHSSLGRNEIVGLLRKPGTIEQDASKLLNALGLFPGQLRSTKSRATALELIIARLEANQVLVSQSQNNFMPQLLRGVKFSGMTIKDAKVPYIFLAGGDEGDHQEPTGRRIFTLTLMGVLVARGIFAPVTYDGHSTSSDGGREYNIVGEILMPAAEMRQAVLTALDDMKTAADGFKVTPSAVVVRALRLGILGRQAAETYLEELKIEYSSRAQAKPRSPKPVNAIRRYNGREFSRRMLDSLDTEQMSPRDFCRVVCLNKIKPSEIDAFREALR